MSRLFDYFKKHRKATIFVVLALAVIFMFLYLQGNRQQKSPYQTETLAKGTLTATVGATGSVRAAQSASLVWQTSGTVDKVNAQVGDVVKKGEALAELAKTSLPQNIILAEADLVTAQKNLDDLITSDTARSQAAVALVSAQDAYDKAKTYRESLNGKIDLQRVTFVTVGGRTFPKVTYYKGYADPETIQKADNDLALKKAQLDDAQRAYDRVKDGPNPEDVAAAQARVDAAQATLNSARIAAPFDGTVTQSNQMPGDQVSAGTTAFRIDDLSSLLVDVQVSEIDINNVSVGQPAAITFDAIPNKTYNGKVTEVSQAGDVVSGAVNFTVTVQLINGDSQVKPGMTAAVNIIVDQINDQLLVANRAVRFVDGNSVVYVLKNGLPQEVQIELGLSDGVRSVVQGKDLKEGDLIVLNPPTQFGPGGGPVMQGGD